MLVLSRRPGEEIVIDGGIRVRVVSVKGSTVRLAIQAPPAVRVDRLEIHARRGLPRLVRAAQAALVSEPGAPALV